MKNYPHPSIHFYINNINDRLVFKIKDGYKLELHMLETIKLFSTTQKLTDQNEGR